MTIEQLADLPEETLIKAAEKLRIKLPGKMAPQQLAQSVFDALEEEEEDRTEANNIAVSIELKKYLVSELDQLTEEDVEEHELPARYNETQIVLMLRDPSWAYIYWDIGERQYIDFFGDREDIDLLLRITAHLGPEESDEPPLDTFEIPIQREDSSRYINLPRLNCWYRAALIGLLPDEREAILVRSFFIKTSRNYVLSDPNADPELERKRDELIRMSGLSFSGASSYTESNPQRILSEKGTDFIRE